LAGLLGGERRELFALIIEEGEAGGIDADWRWRCVPQGQFDLQDGPGRANGCGDGEDVGRAGA